MTSENNLSRNNNHYWSNGAYCVNCGTLEGNVINNNVHPIWHPRCKPGCNSAWHDQEPLEYEETEEDRFYRELEEQEEAEQAEDRFYEDRDRFYRELQEQEEAEEAEKAEDKYYRELQEQEPEEDRIYTKEEEEEEDERDRLQELEEQEREDRERAEDTRCAYTGEDYYLDD